MGGRKGLFGEEVPNFDSRPLWQYRGKGSKSAGGARKGLWGEVEAAHGGWRICLMGETFQFCQLLMHNCLTRLNLTGQAFKQISSPVCFVHIL